MTDQMISPAPTLSQTQRLLWKLITAPEGTAAGLAQLEPAERASAEALARGDARLSVVERLDIYANMYFFRLRDALREDFGAVCAVVGERNFHNLATDYLLAYPPSHYSLRYAGMHLPPFLQTHRLSEQWPYLMDLAALEWAILDVFDATDAPVMDAGVLAAVRPERWPDLRFELTPSLRVLDLEWPVHEVWTAVQRGEVPARPARTRTMLRVWRQRYSVFHCPIDPAEGAALAAITSGARFAEVCDRITPGAGQSDGSARVLALLQAWLGDGLISRFSLSG